MKRSPNVIVILTLLIGGLSLVSLTVLTTQVLATPATHISQAQLASLIKPSPIVKPTSTPTVAPTPTSTIISTPLSICSNQILVTTSWGTVCQPRNSTVTYLLASLICNYTPDSITLYLPQTTSELGPNICDNASTAPIFIVTIVSPA